MVKVTTGEPFDVELDAAPSTGYTWELETIPVGMQMLGKDFRQPQDALIGDGGTQVFHLKTESPGRFELSFALKRRWETTPIQVQQVDVESQ